MGTKLKDLKEPEKMKESEEIQEKPGKGEADELKSQLGNVSATNQVPTEEKTNDVPESSNGKKNKILLGILAVVIVILVGVYVGIALHYHSHFYPGTIINGMDCSELDAAEVGSMLTDALQSYTLEVTGRDMDSRESGAVLGIIAVGDIDLQYTQIPQAAAQGFLEEQNAFAWPYCLIVQKSSGSLFLDETTYDEYLLESTVLSWEACQGKNQNAPENAYISEYSEIQKGYEVVPETIGTKFDTDDLVILVKEAIKNQEASIDIEEAGLYDVAEVTSDDEDLNSAVEAANLYLSTEITYDWNGTEVVLNAEKIKDWIVFDGSDVKLDEDSVRTFVKEQASEYDTYGKSKKFMTALGVELTLRSPNYGWKTDKEAETDELLALIQAGAVTDREPVYEITAMHKGSQDIGDSYVEADLTHQHLYLYQDGEIVFETDFVSGKMNSTPDCITPAGIYGLMYKTRNATLRGDNYATPVDYWMPFYGNYGMHDATWRVNFGGTIYQTHGSHGCINLPHASAATIYEYVSTGFPVICYYYEVDPLLEQAAPTATETPSKEELDAQSEPTLTDVTQTEGNQAEEAAPTNEQTDSE